MKYCTKCGKPNEDESRFCASCGEKFVILEPKQFNDNVIAGDVDMSTVTNIVNNYNGVKSAPETIDIEIPLQRMFIFLEDGNWVRADECCEKVLNVDPICGLAYLGKLMIELKITRQEDLDTCKEPFDENNNYKRAIRFGDEKLVSFLKKQANTVRQQAEGLKTKNVSSTDTTPEIDDDVKKRFEKLKSITERKLHESEKRPTLEEVKSQEEIRAEIRAELDVVFADYALTLKEKQKTEESSKLRKDEEKHKAEEARCAEERRKFETERALRAGLESHVSKMKVAYRDALKHNMPEKARSCSEDIEYCIAEIERLNRIIRD